MVAINMVKWGILENAAYKRCPKVTKPKSNFGFAIKGKTKRLALNAVGGGGMKVSKSVARVVFVPAKF